MPDYIAMVEKRSKELEDLKDFIMFMIETLKRETLAKGQNIYVVQDLKKAVMLAEYCRLYLSVEKELVDLLKVAHDIGVMTSEELSKREEWLKRMREELEERLSDVGEGKKKK